jgi:hypothetical protein
MRMDIHPVIFPIVEPYKLLAYGIESTTQHPLRIDIPPYILMSNKEEYTHL